MDEPLLAQFLKLIKCKVLFSQGVVLFVKSEIIPIEPDLSNVSEGTRDKKVLAFSQGLFLLSFFYKNKKKIYFQSALLHRFHFNIFKCLKRLSKK
jgi:hypothetical protein